MKDIKELLKDYEYSAELILMVFVEQGAVTVKVVKNRNGETTSFYYSDLFAMLEHLPQNLEEIGI